MQAALEHRWLGLAPFEQALALQEAFALQVHHQGMVLGCEHPATITLGRRADPAVDLPFYQDAKLPPVIRIERGGQATFHGPGQLVIYPILPLRFWGIGARAYISCLLTTTQKLFLLHGQVTQSFAERPGLYTAQGKVAFVGVRIRNGVSSHGLAINVHNDLQLFRWVRSCGQSQESFDCLRTTEALTNLFVQWLDLFSVEINRLMPERAREERRRRAELDPLLDLGRGLCCEPKSDANPKQ